MVDTGQNPSLILDLITKEDLMQFLFMRIRRILTLLSFIVLSGRLAVAYDVTLQFDPSTDTAVTGYRMHYGSAPGSYQTSIDIGNQTVYTVTGLGSGTYYFAVKSYTASGVQSSFSNEVSKTLGSAIPISGSLAHSGTMIANSQNFASDHPIEHLWDGCPDATPACSSGNMGVSSFWVEFDFGQQYSLSSARLLGDADGTWTSNSWTLKVRNNPTDSWQTAFLNINAFSNDWSTQSLTVAARFVRVEVAGSAVNNAIQARELEIYGTTGSSSPSLLPPPTNVTVK
jgi:hypothetical protein